MRKDQNVTFFMIIDNLVNIHYISMMKNNLTLAIASVLLSVALLVLSIETKNTTTEKITSLLLGLTTLMMINGLKTIYRHFKQINKAPNLYEK